MGKKGRKGERKKEKGEGVNKGKSEKKGENKIILRNLD